MTRPKGRPRQRTLRFTNLQIDQLRQAIRMMKPGSNLFILLKEELSLRGNWRKANQEAARKGGKAGFAAMKAKMAGQAADSSPDEWIEP